MAYNNKGNLPERFKCKMDGQWHPRNHFSKNEQGRWHWAIRKPGHHVTPENIGLICRAHKGDQAQQLQCHGPCKLFKSREMFTMAQRKELNKWCKNCVAWRTSQDPYQLPPPPPNGQISMEEDDPALLPYLQPPSPQQLQQQQQQQQQTPLPGTMASTNHQQSFAGVETASQMTYRTGATREMNSTCGGGLDYEDDDGDDVDTDPGDEYDAYGSDSDGSISMASLATGPHRNAQPAASMGRHPVQQQQQQQQQQQLPPHRRQPQQQQQAQRQPQNNSITSRSGTATPNQGSNNGFYIPEFVRPADTRSVTTMATGTSQTLRSNMTSAQGRATATNLTSDQSRTNPASNAPDGLSLASADIQSQSTAYRSQDPSLYMNRSRPDRNGWARPDTRKQFNEGYDHTTQGGEKGEIYDSGSDDEC